MEIPGIEQLTSALHSAWSAETGYADIGAWNDQNPARGQCVTSSLVVQDYLGGDIIRYAVNGDNINETHYCNVLNDGTLLDTTRSQYTQSVNLVEKPIDLAKNGFRTVRERCLADDETKVRYMILKTRVAEALGSRSSC